MSQRCSYKSKMLKTLGNKIHPTWLDFLTKEIDDNLCMIESKIGSNYTPDISKILRFLECNLEEVKVIWVGQDPYPEKNKATGRAFEVSNLKSWQDKCSNTSLKNILKLLHKSHYKLKKTKSIAEIRREISTRTFKISSPNQIFDKWEKQGVLFLNTVFTTKIDKPNDRDHRLAWKTFFEDLMEYISNKNPNINYFIWGVEVNDRMRDFKAEIKKDKIYISAHPSSTVSETDNKSFKASECFLKTQKCIQWII